MRVLYDPVTAIVAGVSAIGSIAGGISAAGQATDRGTYERDYHNFQAEQEKVALQRDRDAAERERSQTISRSRAILAAQGGGTESDVIASQEGLFAANEFTLIQDSQARQSMLRTKAGMAEKAGQQAAESAMIKGVTGAIPGLGTLYKEGKSALN